MKSFSILIVALFFWNCASKKPVPELYLLGPEETDTIELSGDIDADSIDFDLLEWAIFKETNVQRERLGLEPFKFEPKLRLAALGHSSEMIELGYFEHESPVSENRTVTQRVEQAGIKNGMSGENLAKHPVSRKLEVIFTDSNAEVKANRYKWRNTGSHYTYDGFARELVSRWMQSPGHRNNITNRYYKYVGVGAAVTRISDVDILYITQNFSTVNY
jgi:uncharacterized protein YkwD